MNQLHHPHLKGEPGWVALDYPDSLKDQPSFVIGDPLKNRLAVRYFMRKKDKRFFGKVFFGEAAQGPPGHAHGGSMAAVLDEAMGFSAWLAGHTVVAAKIAVEYMKMLPVNNVVTVEAWIEKIEGRKVFTRAKLYDREKTFTTSEGLFINIPAEKFGDAAHYLYSVKEQGEG